MQPQPNMCQLLMVVVVSLTLLICGATILRNYITLLQVIGLSLFYEQLAINIDNNSQFVIRVSDLSNCINKQKRGKAVGLDGIACEAYVYGGTKSHVHLCLLINLFLKAIYIPCPVMQAMIIPLVKMAAFQTSIIIGL